MAALGTIAALATIAGTVVTAAGTIASGNAQAKMAQQQGIDRQQAAEFEARQLDIRANEERAAGQVEAKQHRRNKNLALSRLQALSASSGFSATDPTSLAIAEEIETYGEYQAGLANYKGEATQRNLRERAGAARFSGASASRAGYAEASAARTGSYYSAGGTILGGISSAASTYNKFKPRTSAPAPYTGRYG